MLIYRDSLRSCHPKPFLTRLLSELRAQPSDLDSWRDCCVELGELEAGLVDAVFPQVDGCTAYSRALREASGAMASGFVAAFLGDSAGVARATGVAARTVESALQLDLPSQVTTKAAEGFAYYGLYPEQYVLAAQSAFERYRPSRAVVLGLRSIGTTLASVVEATLLRRLGSVRSYVVRPRGEPFGRVARWDSTLERELLRHRTAHFLLVDEGPGLSGSSLTCVAQALKELGIPARHITLMPSYATDGAHFNNEAARASWRAHEKIVGEFQSRWLEPAAPGAELCDLSAGRWRQVLRFEDRSDVCFHPQHERRKYLARGPDGTSAMLRFAGFGTSGRRVRERAEALSLDGLTPRLIAARRGVLALEALNGTLPEPDFDRAGLLPTLAAYAARRRASFAQGQRSSLDTLHTMAQVNIAESLGEEACEPLYRLAERAKPSLTVDTVVDGRLSLQEWLVGPHGYRKLDAWDHGDDHFYPGPCDVAWDLAGASVELGLTTGEERLLLDSYARAARDAAVAERLPFFRVAYLAFRVGYAEAAAQVLAGDPAGARFERAAAHYRRALRARLLGDEA